MKKYLLSLAMTLIAVCSFAQSYTLSFKGYASSTGDYSKSYADTSLVADVFTEGCAAYVASIDAAANVYSARDSINGEYSPCGVKFGSAKAAGSLTFTLATPVEVDSIVFSAAMYGASEGVQGFSVNGVEYPLSAGNKVFEECVWKPEGVVSQITISQILAAKGRFYLNGITVYPKTSEVEPGEEPGGEEPGDEPTVTYEGTALKLTPGGNSNLPLPEDAVRVFTFNSQWSNTVPTPNSFDAAVYKEIVVEFGEALPYYFNTPYKNAAGDQQWGGVAAGNTVYRLDLATAGSITDFNIQNVQSADNCPTGFSIVKAYAVKLDGTQDPILFNAPGWGGKMDVEADIYAANVTFNGQWANVGLDGLAGVEGRKLVRMYTNEPIPAGNVQYCIVTADGADGWPQLTIREDKYAETIIKETLKSSVIQWTSETPGNIDIAAVTYELLEDINTEALAAEIALADSLKATYDAEASYTVALAEALAAAQTAAEWAKNQAEVDSVLNVLQTAEANAAKEYKMSFYANIEDGEYYIFNNEANAYLSNGAYWGTRAVLADFGIAYKFVRNLENGKYTLYSGIKGATKALRPSDGFNDQSGEWEILKAEDGIYLYNGAQYFSNVEGSAIPVYVDEPTAGSVWNICTADAFKSQMDSANEINGVDATIYITAPDFLNSDVKNAAWAGNKVGGNCASGNTLINNTNCEKWNAGTFTVSQTITGIPNGIYSLQAYGFYREGNRTDVAAADAFENQTEHSAILKANEVSVPLVSVYSEAKEAAEGGWSSESSSTSGKVYYIPNSQGDAAACFEAGAYLNTLENIEVVDSTLTISVSREGDAIFDWTVFDNFRLTYFGEKVNVPTFSELVPDSVFYLYNVETHAFVTGGNNWGTRASGNIEKGNQVKVSANGETYKISDLVGANWNAFDVDGNKDSWVDGQGRTGDGTWVITPNGDNTYSITNTVAGDLKWGIQLDMANTRVQFKSNAAYGYTWAFVSVDDYNAYMETLDKDAINAIHAAYTPIVEEAMIEEYNAANAIALEEMKKLIDGTNVYGEGYDAYVQKYEEYKAKYEANELKEFIVNPAAATGWHASTAYNFLLTPWTIGDKAANNWDASLYINTWSVEGTTDGSNFLVPFFEYWTGDSNSLGENTISTTLTGLEAGKTYEVSAWTRVRVKNGAEGVATGITFQAGEGEAVDACAGEQVGTSQFRIIEAVAQGVADEEGNLVVAFNVAADNNISWLSYKNVKYTEVETPAYVSVDGIIEQTLSHPSAGVMGTTTTEQTIKVEKTGDDTIDITFSGFTTPTMPFTFDEFTISDIAVDPEAGTISAEGFTVQCGMASYAGTLVGIEVDGNPALHLTLQNACTDEIYFGVDQAAIDALKAWEEAQKPVEPETWTKTGYIVPAEGWSDFYESALGQKVTITGVVGENKLTITQIDGTANTITVEGNAEQRVTSMSNNGKAIAYEDGGYATFTFGDATSQYIYPNYDCYVNAEPENGYVTLSAWMYSATATTWGYVNIEWWDGIEEYVDSLLNPTPEPAFADTPLTQDMFKGWDGFDASAQVNSETPYWDAAELGSEMGAGNVVYGSGNVTNTDYANLTGASVLRIEGTPGVQLRVMINRQADNSLIEINPTIGEDGHVDVDLSGYDYVHLNAIKLGWGSPAGTITAMTIDPTSEYVVPVSINGINNAVLANGKYFVNGKVVIVRNGIKYNANGVAIK